MCSSRSYWRRRVTNAADQSQFFKEPVRAGGIYTPVYATYDTFRSVVPKDMPQRTFAVIRDPLDTLVSWYFSMRYSHNVEGGQKIAELREKLAFLGMKLDPAGSYWPDGNGGHERPHRDYGLTLALLPGATDGPKDPTGACYGKGTYATLVLATADLDCLFARLQAGDTEVV